MGLFSRKTKADAADFAKGFYDRFVFGSPAGGDPPQAVAESAWSLTGEADPSFAAGSLSNLKEELCAVWLEIIGTAWTHESTVEAALAVSEFTKTYLSSLGRLDLWEAMSDYNAAVAESAMHGLDMKSSTARAWSIGVNKGARTSSLSGTRGETKKP